MVLKPEIKLTLGLIFSPIVGVIEKYLFADWQFVIFLLILVSIDTLLGLAIAWHENNLDAADFGAVFKKVILYLVLLILTHVLVHFTIDGHANTIFGWFNSAAYSAIMVRESLSILANLGKLYPGLVPTSIIKRLKQFDEDGQPKNS